MLDVQVEALLQAIATEMAFLIPGQKQGLNAVRANLAELGQSTVCVASAEAQQEITWSLGLCEQALEHEQGPLPEHLQGLQTSHERLSSALYMAAPLAVTAQAFAQVPQPEAQTQLPVEAGFQIQPGDDVELLNEFCNEGRDLLSHIEQGVLVLEENPQHKETLNQVFRAFHTFKGGAGFLGIDPIKALAHQLESLLDAARRDQLLINRPVIELILAGGDALQQYVDAIAKQLSGQGRGERIAVPTSVLQLRVKACLNGLDPSEWPTTVAPVDAPEETVTANEPPLLPPAAAAPEQAAQPTPPAGPSHLPSPDPVQKNAATQPKQTPGAPARPRETTLASFVKLDTLKLDSLVDLMGELVIAQSMVTQHPLVQTRKDRDLERYLRQLSRITTDLQHNAMSLRMVPIRSVFQKMTRLVRDLATAQNKEVQLHLSGEDTELDRNIVEQLADPLLHMMRNAVDHGIESPDTRRALGKGQGNIHLHAAQQGGGILIRMRDDGKGLDAQRIWAKARQRNLIADDATLTEKDIHQLIFLPGFSTADTVTDISGRGVGMDVVRRSISQLRGRVDIESGMGEGTTFNIYLPLTLAVIDGMLVGLGNERFILPTLTIRESLKPQPGMVFTVQGKGEVVQVRDKLIPLIRLADKLGVPGNATDAYAGIVVVVDSGAHTRALLVDRLIGKQEVVIKSLGETFKHHKGMSGAAIMGDGRVTLIIDPDAVAQLPSVDAQATVNS